MLGTHLVDPVRIDTVGVFVFYDYQVSEHPENAGVRRYCFCCLDFS